MRAFLFFIFILGNFQFSLKTYALDWVGDCTVLKDEEEIKACECKKSAVIVTGKYQWCGKDTDCHQLADKCGGWVTFNKLYLKEFMWITEEPEIIAAVDERPNVICFKKKCINVPKEKE